MVSERSQPGPQSVVSETPQPRSAPAAAGAWAASTAAPSAAASTAAGSVVSETPQPGVAAVHATFVIPRVEGVSQADPEHQRVEHSEAEATRLQWMEHFHKATEAGADLYNPGDNRKIGALGCHPKGELHQERVYPDGWSVARLDLLP